MKPKSAKAKGRRLQNKVVSDFVSRYRINPELLRGRIMGEAGVDIVDGTGLIPLSIECKNVERLNIWDAIRQAEYHVSEESEKIPAVVFTRNGEREYVTMPWEDFLAVFLDPYMEEELKL